MGAREPSFNERDGRLPPSLPLSLSLSLPSRSLARDGRTGIYRVGALAAQIAGLSLPPPLSPPVVLVCLLEQRQTGECAAANDFEAE